jgi:hypothetical protein
VLLALFAGALAALAVRFLVAGAFVAFFVAGLVSALGLAVDVAVDVDGDLRETVEVTRLAAAAVLPASFFAVVRAMAAGPPNQHEVWPAPHACGEDMPSFASLQTPAWAKPVCVVTCRSGRLEGTARRGWDE